VSALSRILLTAATLAFSVFSLVGQQKWVVGMSQCNLGEPWRVQMNADIRKAAAGNPELTVIFKDAQNDTLKQRAHVEEFVSSRVSLLIISPKEAVPLTAPVAEAFRQGIPVIVLDRRVLGTEYTTFIGADNKRIGRAAGRWAAAKLANTGKIVELKGLMTSTPGQDRHSGFLEGIKGTGLEIVFEADMKWLEPNARKEMESALAVHKQIRLVYAHNDPGAHGAYLAARAVGREKEMLFVGIDGLPQEGQVYVQQGILAASFEYPTGGKEAIETALRILKGGKVPKEITLRSRVFTPENIKKGGEWLDQTSETTKYTK
jgi:ribose transport system substrate-binding protein